LSIEVRVGVAPGDEETSVLPLILRGIRERAQLEMRERPEIGGVKISVRPVAAAAPQARGAEHRRIRRGNRHGLILIFPLEPAAVARFARRAPAVSVLGGGGLPGLDHVEADDAAVASLVTRLHAAGHTRIGFLAGDTAADAARLQRRFAGYLNGLASCGLEPDGHRILYVAGEEPRPAWAQTAGAALRRVRKSQVTAWVCASDSEAYLLVRDLEAGGIRVPQDCSVTGFGATAVPDGMRPVTTLRIHHEHVGSSALTRAINRVLYPSSPPRKIVIEAQYVPGETVAGPGRP
jgi:LacI family transcriptional regulator